MTHPNDNRQNASLPSYITNGTITTKTRERVLEVVGKLDYPEAIYSPTMVQETGWDPGSVNRALYHSGFTPGVAKSKKQGRPWFTPDSILAMKSDASVDEHVDEHVDERPEIKIDYEHFTEETFFPMVDRARKAQEAVDKIIAEVEPVAGEPDPEPVVTVRSGIVAPVVKERPELVMPIHEEPVEEITFLDDRNSWAVDLDEVLGEHLGRMVRERLSVLSAVGIEYEMRCWRA